MNLSKLLDRSRPHMLPLLLIAATVAVYGRILGHDFLQLWDDNFYVTGNPDVWGFSLTNIRSAFSRFYIGNYAPVQILSYMGDYTIWGLNPRGFLLTNIGLHLMNGLLVYRLLCQWHKDRVLALFASGIFLLHPVQVETVAWISQRKNLLALLFLLLAWDRYCRYREALPPRGRLAYVASLVAFAASLLAKSMTVVFPAILILHDACFPGEGNKRRYADKIPYLLVAGAVAFVAIYSERPEVGGGGRTGFHGGGPWATFLTMLPVFCSYLKMLLWPVGLSAEYAPIIHQNPDLAVLFASLLLLLVTAGGLLLFRWHRRLGFWVCYFWLGLLPLSQIIPMLSMINDRYLYMPIIGFAVVAGAAVSTMGNYRRGQFRAMTYAAAVVIIFVLAAASFNRTAVWRDDITLFSDVVQRAPASNRGWALLADAYMAGGDFAAVRMTYERALRFNPSNQLALYGLGTFFTSQGDLDAGQQLLGKLLEYNPNHSAGWVGMGENLLKRKDYSGAEKAYRRALEIQPGAFPVYLHLGDLELQRGDLGAARNYYARVNAKDPDSPELAYRLACLESTAGRIDEAMAWLEKSLQRGYRDYLTLNGNTLLANVWDDPRFAMLMLRYFPEQVDR